MKATKSTLHDALALVADLIARAVVAELGRVPEGNRPRNSKDSENANKKRPDAKAGPS